MKDLRHLQHIWRGETLAGARVLARCYHGLGDTLQFIRFAARLRCIAREVVVWVQPKLLPLVAQVAGADRAVPLHDGALEVEYDVDIEVMELAFALRATERTMPRVPYLQAAAKQSRSKRNAHDGEIHVGLVWRAGDWDERRSIDLRLLAPVAEAPARLHLLQPLSAADQPIPFPTNSLACADIQALAATMAQLDLIVTVDTMVAHLAGALGLCRLRLAVGARRENPVYPTMRVGNRFPDREAR